MESLRNTALPAYKESTGIFFLSVRYSGSLGYNELSAQSFVVSEVFKYFNYTVSDTFLFLIHLFPVLMVEYQILGNSRLLLVWL